MGMGLHTERERQCFGVAFCVCAWCPRVNHRGMLRFDYASPSASSPLLPLSLPSAKRRSSRRHPLAPTRLILRVSKSWNQICSQILARPKLASGSSLHLSPKVAVKEVIEKVLAGSIRPHFVVANIGSGFGLYDISKFLSCWMLGARTFSAHFSKAVRPSHIPVRIFSTASSGNSNEIPSPIIFENHFLMEFVMFCRIGLKSIGLNTMASSTVSSNSRGSKSNCNRCINYFSSLRAPTATHINSDGIGEVAPGDAEPFR